MNQMFIGYGGNQAFDNQSREPQYDTDVTYTRNQQSYINL